MTGDVTRRFEPARSTQDALSAGAFRSLLEAFGALTVPLVADETRAAAERQREQVKVMIESHVPDARWRGLMHRAREAAERGEHEYRLLRFRSDACTDRGRAIIEHEFGWPKTLTGDAAAVYRHWHDELKARGFDLTARILEFPGGIPGDAGLFLTWQN